MQWYEATSKKLEAGHRYSHQELIKLLKTTTHKCAIARIIGLSAECLKAGTLQRLRAMYTWCKTSGRNRCIDRPILIWQQN